MFKKVCIIGCGLIGSSIARAIRKKRISNKIVSSNRSEITNKRVIKLNIVDIPILKNVVHFIFIK